MPMLVEICHGLPPHEKIAYKMTVPDGDVDAAHQRIADALDEYREKHLKPGEVESTIFSVECNENNMVLIVTSQYSHSSVLPQIAETIQYAVRRPSSLHIPEPDEPYRRKRWRGSIIRLSKR